MNKTSLMTTYKITDVQVKEWHTVEGVPFTRKEKDQIKSDVIGRYICVTGDETLEIALADVFKNYCVLKSFKAHKVSV